jgi:hypothetical protein
VRRPQSAQGKAARPAEATPETHLRSDGKPVAKKNVQGDYGTYIRFSPTLGKRAEPAHDTTFPVYTAQPPVGTRSITAPLPSPQPVLGDHGRCALSPLTRTQLLAHAPLDPEVDESRGRGPGDPSLLS